MARKKKNNISNVLFTYVGTDAQFDEFLKSVIHDYLVVDSPHNVPSTEIVGKVESEEA